MRHLLLATAALLPFAANAADTTAFMSKGAPFRYTAAQLPAILPLTTAIRPNGSQTLRVINRTNCDLEATRSSDGVTNASPDNANTIAAGDVDYISIQPTSNVALSLDARLDGVACVGEVRARYGTGISGGHNSPIDPSTGTNQRTGLTALGTLHTDLGKTLTVGGTVSVSNIPATQPVSGTVSLPSGTMVNIGGTVAVTESGAWTFAPASGSTWPVSGTVNVGNLPSTQPVSGSVSVSNLPATQPVSGTLAATESGTWTVALSGTPSVNATIQGTPAVTISGTPAVTATISGTPTVNANVTFPATQPVSGSVSVSNFPATQPVSGTVTANVAFPATQPVSGTVTTTQGTSPWAVQAKATGLYELPAPVTAGTANSAPAALAGAATGTAFIKRMICDEDASTGFWYMLPTASGAVAATRTGPSQYVYPRSCALWVPPGNIPPGQISIISDSTSATPVLTATQVAQ